MDEQKPSRLGVIFLWACCYAGSLTLVHVGVRAFFGTQGLDWSAFGGILAGAFGQLVTGALLAFLVLPQAGASRYRYLAAWGFTVLVIAVTIAAYHYEAMFGRYPGLSFVDFATEARRLGGPIAHRLPEAAVALETTIVVSLLAALSRMVHDIEEMMAEEAAAQSEEDEEGADAGSDEAADGPGTDDAPDEGANGGAALGASESTAALGAGDVAAAGGAGGDGSGEAGGDGSAGEGDDGAVGESGDGAAGEGDDGESGDGEDDEELEELRFPGNPRVATAVLGLGLIGTVALHAVPALKASDALAPSVLPIYAFAHALYLRDPLVGELNEPDAVFFRLTTATNPAPMVDADYPVCAPAPRREEAVFTGEENRSVIVLVLDSLGAAKLGTEIEGQPLLPSLRQIASDGAHFPSIYAGGREHALPALFAGVPAVLSEGVLGAVPPPALDGWPAKLGRAGYQTPGFYGGGDPAVANFLREIGVSTLELGESGRLPDTEVLREIPGWVDALRAADPRAPYTAVFVADEPRSLEASQQLDAVIGELYVWFQTQLPEDEEEPEPTPAAASTPEGTATPAPIVTKNELRPPGTLLIVVGSHQSVELDETNNGRVPLIVAGLTERELERAREAAQRPGGQHDLGATLMPLLRQRIGSCDGGVDLLSAEEEWPASRTVATPIAGGDLLFVNANGSFRWVAATKKVGPYEATPDPGRELPEGELARLERLGAVTGPLSQYLVRRDAFAPR